MSKTIDARGLSCPHPVLMTLNGIKSGEADEMIILVDNEASKENVSRAAASKGWAVTEISKKEDLYHIAIKRR
ncbi:MAG: sulfurtransferase TusA family protein [Syntrophales bacterium]